MTNMFARGWFCVCTLALALAAGGCATQVATDPEGGGEVASYNWGTLTGTVRGDTVTVFHAANNAMDDLNYARMWQAPSGDWREVEIRARAVGDLKVTVEIKPAKDAGLSLVEISIGTYGDLYKSQILLAAIERKLNQPGGASAPAAALNSPAAPL